MITKKEEPLPSGGSCCLCSINLAEYVNLNNFDFESLEKDVPKIVRAINQVLLDGLSLHPLEEQRQSVSDWRQVGIGTFGLSDAFIKLKIKYGSQESLELIEKIYKLIATTAVRTSIQLAKEKDCYPKCNKELLAESPFIKALDLPESDIQDIKEYGMFNSQLLTCAPCGSIATMIEVSTGVEPIYALKYTRKTISLEGKDSYFEVYTKIARDWMKENPGKKLPDYFIESKDITPEQRVCVQGALQCWIDASISSTTNLPKEAIEQDVYNVYMKAWKEGCKGITIYRSECAREGILTPKKKEEPIQETQVFDSIEPISREELGTSLNGTTSKYHTACGTLYVTINKDENGNIVEIFTNSSKNGTCKANLNGETRMASLALRSGVKVCEVVDQLKGIHCQACVRARAKNQNIDGVSCPDIISKAILDAYDSKTIISTKKKRKSLKSKENDVSEDSEEVLLSSEMCPECGSKLDHVGGCVQCSCGYSKCG